MSGNVGTTIVGSYGTLQLFADGHYIYTANPDAVTSNQVDHFVLEKLKEKGLVHS